MLFEEFHVRFSKNNNLFNFCENRDLYFACIPETGSDNSFQVILFM